MKTSSNLDEVKNSSRRLGKLANRKRVPTQNLEIMTSVKKPNHLSTNPSKEKVL